MELRLADRIITTERPAFVMGIVNATPDSFYSESRGGADRALSLVDEGADIIDIGGESTRPGSEYVSAEEEIERIVPVIEAVRKKSSVPISVDTRKCEVMKAARKAGADILNDVSALEDDSLMASYAASEKIPVVLMHKRGIPSTMQEKTSYKDVFADVDAYLSSRVRYAVSNGISPEKIIVDPGVGFGKGLRENAALIARAGSLCGGKYPVLMALSMKTCIGQMTGKDTEDRLIGTVAANLLSVVKGASLVRVHDVGSCIESLDVLKCLLENGFGEM
ncbi:MAG TPA: dihydropteroate synthase [Treponema sp.]|nr:dihydropteroate synthase [Treponema sp.]HCA20357.1 dihydropteroate synthase [Treponema sp.]